MTPGREMDALVAEKVMGWTKDKLGAITIVGNPNLSEKDWILLADNISPYPLYSTDISAAWEVVEKMIKYNPFWKKENAWEYFQLTCTSGHPGKNGWVCNFADSENDAYGDTAPHAICLAALKACGVEV